MPPQIDPTRMNADPLANELGPQPTLDPQLLEDSSRELQNYLDAPFIPAFERFYVDDEGNYNMPEWKRQHWSALLKAHGWSGSSKEGFRYPEGQTPPGEKVHMSGVGSYLDRRDARRDKLNQIGTKPYSIQQGHAPGPHRSEMRQGGRVLGVSDQMEESRLRREREESERKQGKFSRVERIADLQNPPIFEKVDGEWEQVEGKRWIYRYGEPIEVDVNDPRSHWAREGTSGYSLLDPNGVAHPDQPKPGLGNKRMPPGGAPPAGAQGPAGQPGRSGPGAPSPLDAVTKPGDAGAEFPDFVPTEREFGAEGPNAFFFREGEEAPLLPERSDPGRPAPRPGMMYGNRQAPPGMQPDPNVAVPGYTPGIDSREYPPFDPNKPFGYEEPDSQWIDTVSGQAGRRGRRGQPPRTSDTPFFDQTRAARRADRRGGAVPPVPQEITQYEAEEPQPEFGGDFFGMPPAPVDPFADFDPALREDARAIQDEIDAERASTMSAGMVEQMIIEGYDDYLIKNGVLSRGEIAQMKAELIRQGKIDEGSPRDRVERGLSGVTAPGAADPGGQLKLLQRIKANRQARQAARQQGRQ